MPFNIEKCKLLHIGKVKGHQAEYFMQNHKLEDCNNENDLHLGIL